MGISVEIIQNSAKSASIFYELAHLTTEKKETPKSILPKTLHTHQVGYSIN